MKKNKNDKISKTGNRYSWISPGIPELQEGIELHLIPKGKEKVTLSRDEYDTLIESRYIVKLIEKMIRNLPEYQLKETLKMLFDEAKEDSHEPKSE